MRILLDECLHRGLKKHLPDQDVFTVPEAGWAELKNGALLRAASGTVDVFVTVDRSLTYQHRLNALPFGVVTRSRAPAAYLIWSRSFRRSALLSNR